MSGDELRERFPAGVEGPLEEAAFTFERNPVLGPGPIEPPLSADVDGETVFLRRRRQLHACDLLLDGR
jgi:hypothetical protein